MRPCSVGSSPAFFSPSSWARGTTLHGPDVLLHHWGAQAEQEKCTLGQTAAGAGAALVQSPVVRADVSGAPAPVITHPAEIVVTDLDAPPRSRAPPAFAV
jgi:hypothetical protein